MPTPIDDIAAIAANSPVAHFPWPDRGAPGVGYIKGMCVAFARAYCGLKSGAPAAVEMAKAATGGEFAAAGLDNSRDGADTLRHVFVFLIGLGMRESSGKYCEGRDHGADNTDSETAEAGLFQTSWNLWNAHPLLPALFKQYAGSEDFLEIFKEGVSCAHVDAINYGTGDGKEFQRLTKACPAFAVEFAGVGIRNKRTHWGPINTRAVTIHNDCDTMLAAVQALVDAKQYCPYVEKPKPAEGAN
jgi:hypothetical protein